ncbi:MAG: endonuclease/exonuclease/phosphatase family protein [Phycisphaerae bacterium]|nr:endonuclease/exonuclease/phosphatase family protein [Phycisphaerae bacterium]
MSAVLRHTLMPQLAALRECRDAKSLRASPRFRQIEPDVRRLLDAVVTYEPPLPASMPVRRHLRAVAWNIERGARLDDVVAALTTHPDLRDADLYLLTELDFGMARSGNRDVPGEIARRLNLRGAFAPCYLNLDKGSGLERSIAAENEFGLHGNALFSRGPIEAIETIRLPNGRDKLLGRERRIGSQRVVVATLQTPIGPVRAASIHLDAHSSRGHRRRQMRCILDRLDAVPALPTLIGGDWNTSTHNTQRACWSIIGFWARVAIGVRYCLRAHYPHPDRFFERRLFRMLERRGYDYRRLNEPGGCTLHHCILAEADRSNLRDWLPEWCLAYVEWALRPFGGICSLKLDWVAARGLRAVTDGPLGPPRVVQGLRRASSDGDARSRISDHDPIVVELAM